jgi:hypothetical protein
MFSQKIVYNKKMIRNFRFILLLLVLNALLTACSVIHVKDRSQAVVKHNPDAMFNARNMDGEMRRRILVLPFLNVSSYNDDEVVAEARTYFLSQVEKMDLAVLIEPNAVGIENLDAYKSGTSYKVADIVKKIKNSGVHAIVVGTIKDLKTGKRGDSVGIFRRVKAEIKAVAELQIVSVRSGQVMATDTQDSDMSEGSTKVAQRAYMDQDMKDDPTAVRFVVETAFEKTLPALFATLKRFSWEGRVALVKGERVYLNSGRVSGLQIGDLLRIVEEQEEVFDPQSSRSIGSVRGRMKGTVEVVSYFGNDGAVAQVHSGSGFHENDLVEFY